MWDGAGGTGAGAGATGVSSFVTDLMASLPPALHTMMNIGGVQLSEELFKVAQDEESPSAAQHREGEEARRGQGGRADRRDGGRAEAVVGSR